MDTSETGIWPEHYVGSMRMIERVDTLWCTHPEVRLGQLLATVSPDLSFRKEVPLVNTREQFAPHISPR